MNILLIFHPTKTSIMLYLYTCSKLLYSNGIIIFLKLFNINLVGEIQRYLKCIEYYKLVRYVGIYIINLELFVLSALVLS